MATKRFPLEIIISAIDKFTSGFASFGSKLDRIGRKADQLGKNLSLKVTLPMTLLGRYSLKSAADLEQLEIRFTSLVGSAEKAADMMQELKTFAASTPFDIMDTGNAAAGLMAAGTAAENVIPTLRMLGDIAAGSGRRLDEMIPLYTELQIKGKAFTQDLRQFATRGIPIISVLAKQLGVSEARIFKMAEQGRLKFPMIEKALKSMREEGGLFADQMNRQSRSLAGVWAAFQDTVMFASAEFGQAAAKAVDLSGKLEFLGQKIKELTAWFTQLSPLQQKIIVYFALFITVLGPLLVIFGQLAMAMSFIIGALGGITLAGAALFAQITLLTGLFAYLIWQFMTLVKMAGGLGKALFVLGGVIIDALLTPFQGVLKVVEALWNKLGTAPEWLTTAANFSFGQAAANITEGVPASEQGAGQRFTAAQRAAAAPAGQAKVEVSFKNAPAGTRANVVENQNSNVTVDQGIAMAGGY